MTRAELTALARGLAPVLMRLRAKDGVNGSVGPKGSDGRDGRDGVQGVQGEPGANGRDGVDGKDGTAGLSGKDGADGLHGTDGKDAVLKQGDIFIKMLSERSYCWCFGDGTPIEVEHLDGTRSKSGEIYQPAVIDRGVYAKGADYEAGDGITWDGHFWIAQKDTHSEPGERNPDWRLAVRRGKQGREGKDGKDAPALTPSNTPPLYS